MRRAVLGLLAASALLVTACEPAAKPLYHLDEPAGSSTVTDANGVQNGTATHVTFGQPGKTNTAARFNGTSSIIRIPNNAAMNPGDGDFSVTASVRFTAVPTPTTFDIVRKGISGDGGYWKMELFTSPTGSVRARCVWRDNAGVQTSLVRGNGLNNDAWHTITCAIVGDEHRITVDGGTSANTPTTPLGTISNNRETTFGAKPDGGDWYNGLLDEVVFG